MTRRVHQIILGLDETPVKAPQYRSAKNPACPSHQAGDCTGGVSSLPPVPFNSHREQWIAAEIAKAKR